MPGVRGWQLKVTGPGAETGQLPGVCRFCPESLKTEPGAKDMYAPQQGTPCPR